MTEELREQIAELLNWYGNACQYVDWNVVGNEDTKDYRRNQAIDFLQTFKEAGYVEVTPEEAKLILRALSHEDIIPPIDWMYKEDLIAKLKPIVETDKVDI